MFMSKSPLMFVSTAERRIERLAFWGYPFNDGALHSLRVISAGATCSLLDLKRFINIL
jgi:hypothetical protein